MAGVDEKERALAPWEAAPGGLAASSPPTADEPIARAPVAAAPAAVPAAPAAAPAAPAAAPAAAPVAPAAAPAAAPVASLAPEVTGPRWGEKTPKELKQLLAAAGVAFSGCIEKSDLVHLAEMHLSERGGGGGGRGIGRKRGRCWATGEYKPDPYCKDVCCRAEQKGYSSEED